VKFHAHLFPTCQVKSIDFASALWQLRGLCQPKPCLYSARTSELMPSIFPQYMSEFMSKSMAENYRCQMFLSEDMPETNVTTRKYVRVYTSQIICIYIVIYIYVYYVYLYIRIQYIYIYIIRIYIYILHIYTMYVIMNVRR
jgi:hypothetical protein